MSANNKYLQTTVDGKPAPQYYNDTADQYEVTKGKNGAGYSTIVDANGTPIATGNRLPVDIGGATISATLGDQQAKTIDVVLQNNATAIGTGTPFSVAAYKTLTIEITGTSTGRTIVFEGSSTSGTFYSIQGVKLSDYSMATQTTGTSEVWSFDITGLTLFQARISAISAVGNVSVKGKAVA